MLSIRNKGEKKITRRILFISIFIDLIFLGFVYFFFFKPVQYRYDEIYDINTLVPSWKSEPYISNTWKGKVYKYIFLTIGIYQHSPSEIKNFYKALLNKMKPTIYSEDLNLFEEGKFYYLKKGEKTIGFSIFFIRKNKIYFIDFSSSGFMTKQMEILKNIVFNLKIEGEKIPDHMKSKFEKTLSNVPIQKSKRGEFVLLMIGAILITTQIFILAIFSFIGRCPRELEKEIIVCSSNSYIEVRKPLQLQTQPACICLKPGYIVVFTGGKKSMEISLDEIEWNLKKKQGKYGENTFKIPELYEWRIHLPLRDFEL
ncbi:MAG: hypothetical protein ACUVUG_09470 [Candidatus Aminicenantia bacterium]